MATTSAELAPKSEQTTKGLSVTQFVSYLVFLAVFSRTIMETNLTNSGFGLLRADQVGVEFGRAWKLALLWIICFGTGARTYISFWYVEQSYDFERLREKWGYIRKTSDWFVCRALCFLCVNMFPIAIAANKRGWMEGLLIASYAIMVAWDLLVGMALCKQDKEPTYCALSFKGCKRGHFKSQIRIWTWLDIIGLVVSGIYVILVLNTVSPVWLTLALGILAFPIAFIVLFDLFYWNVYVYKRMLLCPIAIAPVFFLVQFLSQK